ncbi:MAG: hypothetical protein OCC49_07500 [Fibrobacterales bacterium]
MKMLKKLVVAMVLVGSVFAGNAMAGNWERFTVNALYANPDNAIGIQTNEKSSNTSCTYKKRFLIVPGAMEGVKSQLALLMMAKQSGDEVHFYVTSSTECHSSGYSVITNVMLGTWDFTEE